MENNIAHVFIQMLEECPQDKIVWNTMSQQLTAVQMIEEVRNESDIAKLYVSEVLRISRDFISRN